MKQFIERTKNGIFVQQVEDMPAVIPAKKPQTQQFVQQLQNGQFVETIQDKATPGTPGNLSVNPANKTPGALRPRQKYYNDMSIYTAPVQIQSGDCAETLFYNRGTAVMLVNGVPFDQFTGISFDGNENEQDVTKYTIDFEGIGTMLAFVVKKIYVS
jgi:hypothetical protein